MVPSFTPGTDWDLNRSPVVSVLSQPLLLADISDMRAVNEQRFEVEVVQLLSAGASEWRIAVHAMFDEVTQRHRSRVDPRLPSTKVLCQPDLEQVRALIWR